MSEQIFDFIIAQIYAASYYERTGLRAIPSGIWPLLPNLPKLVHKYEWSEALPEYDATKATMFERFPEDEKAALQAAYADPVLRPDGSMNITATARKHSVNAPHLAALVRYEPS